MNHRAHGARSACDALRPRPFAGLGSRAAARAAAAALAALAAAAAFAAPWGALGAANADYDPDAVVHYTVQPGDTLWSIAGRFSSDPGVGSVERLKAVNGLDGGAIRPGQHLVVPL